MQPTNTKSLFHFLTDQMESLREGKITIEDAKAQANLARQINNILKYELSRVDTLIDIDNHNSNQNFKPINLREVESKAFDNTI